MVVRVKAQGRPDVNAQEPEEAAWRTEIDEKYGQDSRHNLELDRGLVLVGDVADRRRQREHDVIIPPSAAADGVPRFS
jgi:hypothetical protein